MECSDYLMIDLLVVPYGGKLNIAARDIRAARLVSGGYWLCQCSHRQAVPTAAGLG
jgi:hypothetical protein